MIREHDLVTLAEDLPELGLKPGDVGTVVFVHRDGEGFEVEFVTLDGVTLGVATLLARQVRPVGRGAIANARVIRTSS
jgi:hypothetical protein